MYGDPTTAEKAGKFLNQPDIRNIEDWGCGQGGFRDYIGKHQTYIGIDGSQTQFADKIADLEAYRSQVDAIHVRHILEHNPGWRNILRHALASFQKRMVLTLFTPFIGETKFIAVYPQFTGLDIMMVDIAFARDDIVGHFEGIRWHSEEGLVTETQYKIEHVFYLQK
jgi:hypothetical protein